MSAQQERLKQYQEIADRIIATWVEQMRADEVLVLAMGLGCKVEVRLHSINGRVPRTPDVTVPGDNISHPTTPRHLDVAGRVG